MKITAFCPRCNASLVLRRNRENNTDFLGCSEWPMCGYTQPLPQDVQMRLAGAPTLPGF